VIFAARKLQGIGLIMLLTLVALIAYPVSLRVSATRNELQRVERDIARVRMQNRMIEGDIAVLANARQLDTWNNEYFAFVPPQAGQYLSGERALAQLRGLRQPNGTAPTAPVLVAMQAEDATTPALTDDGDTPESTQTGEQRRAVTASTVRDMRRTVALVSDSLPGAVSTARQ
jgi:hypothetical protein